jgi:hypothetical protein
MLAPDRFPSSSAAPPHPHAISTLVQAGVKAALAKARHLLSPCPARAPFPSRADALDHDSASSSPRPHLLSATCTSTPPSTITHRPLTHGGGRSGWTWPRTAAAAPSPPLVAGTHDHAGSRGSCGTTNTSPAPFVPSEAPSPFGTLAGMRTDPPPELIPSPSVPSQEHIDLLLKLLPS